VILAFSFLIVIIHKAVASKDISQMDVETVLANLSFPTLTSHTDVFFYLELKVLT
jgi:hypothetical protein